jgi:two-component system OmpR family response regulator
LLELFLTRPGRVLSKEQIAERLTGFDEQLSPNAIEVHVSRLRTKLEPAGLHIRTVRGFGYLWEGADE